MVVSFCSLFCCYSCSSLNCCSFNDKTFIYSTRKTLTTPGSVHSKYLVCDFADNITVNHRSILSNSRFCLVNILFLTHTVLLLTTA